MLKVGYEKSKFYLFVVLVFSADFSYLLYSRLKLDRYGWTHGMVYGVGIDPRWTGTGTGEVTVDISSRPYPSPRAVNRPLAAPQISVPRVPRLSYLRPLSLPTHTHTRALAMGKSIGDSASDNAIRLHSATTPTQKLGLLVFSSILVALLYCAPLPPHQSVVGDRNKERTTKPTFIDYCSDNTRVYLFQHFLPFNDIFVRCWNVAPLYVDEKLSHWSNDHFKHYDKSTIGKKLKILVPKFNYIFLHFLERISVDI